MRRAVERNDFVQVCQCIRRGGNPNFETALGWTPLTRAVSVDADLGEDVEQVRALLKLGALANFVSRRNGTAPVVLAATFGKIKVVEVLLRNGADVDLEQPDGRTALTAALAVGKIETMATFLIETCCADANRRNSFGETPLMQCASHFSLGLPCARFLVQHGAKVTPEAIAFSRARRQWTLATFLNEQCFAQNRALRPREHGVGQAVKDTIVQSHSIERILRSIEDGVLEPDHETLDGETAMMFAAQFGHLDALSELFRMGADVDFQNRFGATPLIQACRSGSTRAARVLIHVMDADLEICDAQGFTALMHAAANGHLTIARVLLAARANVAHANDLGLNAATLALGAQQVHVLQYLEAFQRSEGVVRYDLFCLNDTPEEDNHELDQNQVEQELSTVEEVMQALADVKARRENGGVRKTLPTQPLQSALRIAQGLREMLEGPANEASIRAQETQKAKQGRHLALERAKIAACRRAPRSLRDRVERKAEEAMTKLASGEQENKERRHAHHKTLLENCHVQVAESKSASLQFDMVYQDVTKRRDSSPEDPQMLILRPVQLELANHLIETKSNVKEGITLAQSLMDIQAARFGKEPAVVQIPTMVTLGMGFAKLQKTTQAAKYLQQAVNVCLSLEEPCSALFSDTIERTFMLLVECGRFEHAKAVLLQARDAQVSFLGPKHPVVRKTNVWLQETKQAQKSQRFASRQRELKEQREHTAAQDVALTWRKERLSLTTFLKLTSDYEAGWPLFFKFACKQECHKLVAFCQATRDLQVAQAQGKWVCSDCEHHASADHGTTKRFLRCPECGQASMEHQVSRQMRKVVEQFLKTNNLEIVPKVLRNNVAREVTEGRGPEAFDPVVDLVMHHVHATLFKRFVDSQEGFAFVVGHFFTANPDRQKSLFIVQRFFRAQLAKRTKFKSNHQ